MSWTQFLRFWTCTTQTPQMSYCNLSITLCLRHLLARLEKLAGKTIVFLTFLSCLTSALLVLAGTTTLCDFAFHALNCFYLDQVRSISFVPLVLSCGGGKGATIWQQGDKDGGTSVPCSPEVQGNLPIAHTIPFTGVCVSFFTLRLRANYRSSSSTCMNATDNHVISVQPWLLRTRASTTHCLSASSTRTISYFLRRSVQQSEIPRWKRVG